MSETNKLKDLFTAEVIRHLGEDVAVAHPGFDVDAFVATAIGGDWLDLTFTQRSQRIADVLWSMLDMSPRDVLDVLVTALPFVPDDGAASLSDGLRWWPFGDLIATYCVEEYALGMAACVELTKHFTAEFAVRPFLTKYPQALERVAGWTHDPNENVRRLASEGTRPRLPWAKRLDLPVDAVLDLLSQLRSDPSPYVRRSVANHLNDLAKDDPERIITLLETWHAEGVEETTQIVRHAMRNLLKQGHPRALALFGFESPQIQVRSLSVDPDPVAIGDRLRVDFELRSTSTAPQRLMVDLVVGFATATGHLAPKVFKFREIDLSAQAVESCVRTFDFVHRSTRRLHPGAHHVTVRVNGQDLATRSFDVVVAPAPPT